MVSREGVSMPTAAPIVDKRGDRVRAMFASIASRYDLLNHVLSLNIDKAWRRFTVKTLAPAPSVDVLDVCTGTGDLAIAFAQAQPSARITGLDFCPPMLDVARQKNDRQHFSITFGEADAMALPVEADSFDIVTCAFGLRNIADTRQGLGEMVRVARPGGRVAILEFSRPRVPVLRWLYLAYFKYLLPRIGQAVSKNDHAAYEYLPASVMTFPDGQEMLDLMSEMGLHTTVQHPLTLGIATLYIGVKPPAG
jgi:demethylmenaquinone methyltransferase/2-methoxy-6-polyprenyl-1,4-benzoquinol methylase